MTTTSECCKNCHPSFVGKGCLMPFCKCHTSSQEGWKQQLWKIWNNFNDHGGHDTSFQEIADFVSQERERAEQEFDELLITSMPNDAENLATLTDEQAGKTIKNLLKRLLARSTHV